MSSKRARLTALPGRAAHDPRPPAGSDVDLLASPAPAPFPDPLDAPDAAGHNRTVLDRQPEMARFRDDVDRHLSALDRPHEWSLWEDEGILALRLRVLLGEAGLSTPVGALTYWVREGDDGVEVMVDQHDAPVPTPFARLTRRQLAPGALGFRQARQLVSVQAAYPSLLP